MDYKGAKGSGTDRVASYGEISAINSMLFNTQTTDYTLVLTDANSGVNMNGASSLNLTVPPNSSVAFAIGTQIVVEQGGAGAATIVPGAGVTLNGASLVTSGQYGVICLIKTGTDTWLVVTGNYGPSGNGIAYAPTVNTTLTAGMAYFCADQYEIINTYLFEITNTSFFEIG